MSVAHPTNWPSHLRALAVVGMLVIVGAGKPAFFGAGWFYALLIVVYLALIYLLFLYRSSDREEDPDL